MTPRRECLKAWLLPGIAIALMVGILLGRASVSILWCAAAVAVSLAAVLLGRDLLRFAAIMLLVASLGGTHAYLSYHPALPLVDNAAICGVVTDPIRSNGQGHVRTVLRDVTIDGVPFHSGVYWSFYTDAIPDDLIPGASVAFTARTYAPDGASNPGGYDFRESQLQNGVTLGAYGMSDLTLTHDCFSLHGWFAGVRHAMEQQLLRVMGPEAGSYAAAMLLGSRSMIGDEDREAFSRLGIAHILSVSGFHVGVLSLALSWLLRRTRLTKGPRLLIRALVLSAYALLAGLRAPIVRAALLSLLPEYCRFRHRNSSLLHMVSASAILILLVNPAQLTSAGFQLTYAAVMGILIVVPWLNTRLARPMRFPRSLWNGLLTSLGAQLGLLLPELYWFQEIPLFGLPFNALVMLLSPLLLGLYWVTWLIMWIPFVGPLFGQAAAGATSLLLSGIRTVGSADWLTLWTCQANWLTALGCLLLLWGLSRARLPDRRFIRPVFLAFGLCLTVTSLIPWPSNDAAYTQLSVGSADAAVLQDRDAVCVIDAGTGQTLSTYLHQRRLSVDTLILTHLHADHADGVHALLDNHIPIRTCCIPSGTEDALISDEMRMLLDELAASGTQLRTVSRGDVIPLPDGQLTVLWPEDGKTRPGREANESSMALLAQIKGTTMLLTGDLAGRYEAYAAFPADVLKVAHHGSADSTSQAFLSQVNPQVLLLSCGDANRESSMQERSGGIPLYSTRTNGAVTLRFSNHDFIIEEYK